MIFDLKSRGTDVHRCNMLMNRRAIYCRIGLDWVRFLKKFRRMIEFELRMTLFLRGHCQGLLEACNSSNATYLFQQDKHYDLTYDTGDKAIQCGRHNDVFKLWLAWRAKGDSGYEKQVDYAMDLSR